MRRAEASLLDADRPPAGRDARAVWAFETWGRPLLAFLRRLAGDAHDAEALAQEVFCRFLQAEGDFATAASVRAWLFRVGRNLALDHHKKRRPRLLSQGGDGGEGGDPLDAIAGTTGVDAVEQQEYLEKMRQALDRIPPLYRGTLVLRFLEEWSYDAIAAVEGVSPSALRTRVQKGLALLRAELGLDTERTDPVEHRSGTA